MTARGDTTTAPGPLSAPHGWPPTRAEAAGIILGLLDAVEAMRAYADGMYRAGFRAGVTATAGYCATHHADLADAQAEGARLAAADQAGGASAFAVGWNACLDRLGDEIGGRAAPAHPTEIEIIRYTRHAPRCRRGGKGGNQSCQRSGCIRRTRQTWADPAPWDVPHDQAAMIAKARASWGLS